MKAKIIGAGIAGLAAAVRMQVQGFETTVFEAYNTYGGKMKEIRKGGFRWDAGPSLFTMPQYVKELFTMAGRPMEDYFQYQKLDTICNYFWEDGTTLSTVADHGRNIENIANALNEEPASIVAHLKDSKRKYELTGKTFTENSLHKAGTWLTKDVAKAMTQLHHLDLMTTMHKANAKRFSNPKTVQLFDRYATYNGSNPYKTPGLLNIIPHYEYGFGAFLPKHGMYDIATAVYQLALDLGVEFHFDTKVEAIRTKNDQVVGVVANGKEVHSELVISNMDVYYTYLNLLDKPAKAESIKKQERSSSALIFYWGVGKTFPELDVHNILFAEDYRSEFEHIAKGEVSGDPTVYINITSKEISADAPSGKENWFVMINVPHDSGQNWNQIKKEARKNIIAKLNRVLGVTLSDLIECEETLDPVRIDQETFSHTGSLYGTSSNNKFAAFLRHPNFSNRVRGLYFCGGSVHPGGGIPLCLLSAKIIHAITSSKYKSA